MTDPKISSKLFFKNLVYFLEDCVIVQDEKKLKHFQHAVSLYCYFTFQLDNLVDGDLNLVDFVGDQNKVESNPLFEAVKAHQKSIEILHTLFNSEDEFWKELENCSKIYLDGLVIEKYNSDLKPNLSWDDFEKYSITKHNLAFIPLLGMYKLFDSKKQNYVAVQNMMNCIFKGMQMNDDLEDFTADEKNKQWTYAHARVREFILDQNLENKKHLDKFSERVFYVSGIGMELNTYAKNQFSIALDLAKQEGLTQIQTWIQENLRSIESNEKLIYELTQD